MKNVIRFRLNVWNAAYGIRSFAALSVVVCLSFFAHAQGPPVDPCDTAFGPGCQSGGGNMMIASDVDTVAVNTPFDLFAGVMASSTGRLDTSYLGTITLSQVSGPGTLMGTLSGPLKGFTYFDTLWVDQPGNYQISISDGALAPYILNFFADTIGSGGGGPGGPGGGDPCDTAFGPGCQSGGGNLIGTSDLDSVIVNNPFDLYGVVFASGTGLIDTTYTGTMTITLLQGPGMLNGPLSEPLKGWAFFGGLSVSHPGHYVLEISDGVLTPDTLDFDAYLDGSGGGPVGSGDPCDTTFGPGCQSGGGNLIGTSDLDSIFVNDPFNLYGIVLASGTGLIDTTYTGTMTINLL